MSDATMALSMARIRRFASLTAVAAAVAVVLVSTGTAGSRTAGSAAPTLYFMYAMNCTFAIVDDAGKTVSSIPPGHYQVDVRTPLAFGTMPLVGGPANDMTACKGAPQFQLTGPGVDLFTTMTAGCESDKVFTETFQPNGTYVAQDLNQPSVAHGSFTTLASGTPVVPVVTYGGGKGKPEVSTDIVGSLAVKGTLDASVSAAGTPVLKNAGKTVATLKAGRYKFTITDRDPKHGFLVLGPTSKSPTNLTGVKFVGTKSLAVKLTAGKWTYYTNLGTIRFFRVTG
jgi:hypothetical protein